MEPFKGKILSSTTYTHNSEEKLFNLTRSTVITRAILPRMCWWQTGATKYRTGFLDNVFEEKAGVSAPIKTVKLILMRWRPFLV